MNITSQTEKPLHLRVITYTLSFFLAIHGYLVVYINSSALSQIIPPQAVGLLYTFGALLSVIGLSFLPKILSKVGDFRATLSFLIVEVCTMTALAVFFPSPVVVVLFLVHVMIMQFLRYNIDIFLESDSKDEQTGSIRGIFLTINNIALVCAPFVIGKILKGGNDYSAVYTIATLALIPALLILGLWLKQFKDVHYHQAPLLKTIKRLKHLPSVRRIIICDFLLRFFYSWMVIYTPLYLHEYVGLPWSSIGIIFTIMLLPFALFEFPLGRLSDTRYGEKEFLTAGFLILGIATASISFIGSTSLPLWALILFLTRTGASAVEIMTETYFFKKTDHEDADIISLFRMSESGAYIVAPLLATVLLFILPLQYLFLILGVIALSGILFARKIRDTR